MCTPLFPLTSFSLFFLYIIKKIKVHRKGGNSQKSEGGVYNLGTAGNACFASAFLSRCEAPLSSGGAGAGRGKLYGKRLLLLAHVCTECCRLAAASKEAASVARIAQEGATLPDPGDARFWSNVVSLEMKNPRPGQCLSGDWWAN